MTIIVGLIDQDRVHMGADTIGSNGNAYVFKNSKIVALAVKRPFWDKKQERTAPKTTTMLVGCSGSYRAGQIVEVMDVPDWPANMSSYKYLIGTFVPAVRHALIDGGAMGKDDGQRDESDLTMLVALNGFLFVIWPDLSVTQPEEDYAVIGRGTDLALGALHATRGDAPQRRILAALQAAAAYDQSCGAPFDLVDEDGNNTRVLDEYIAWEGNGSAP